MIVYYPPFRLDLSLSKVEGHRGGCKNKPEGDISKIRKSATIPPKRDFARGTSSTYSANAQSIIKKRGYPFETPSSIKVGDDLLSHNAVPSALAGLTSLFGMGRGGTPPL